MLITRIIVAKVIHKIQKNADFEKKTGTNLLIFQSIIRELKIQINKTKNNIQNYGKNYDNS